MSDRPRDWDKELANIDKVDRPRPGEPAGRRRVDRRAGRAPGAAAPGGPGRAAGALVTTWFSVSARARAGGGDAPSGPMPRPADSI